MVGFASGAKEPEWRLQWLGVTWTVVNASLPLYALVTPDPATAGVFYMIQEFGGPLFRSADGGATFAALGDRSSLGHGTGDGAADRSQGAGDDLAGTYGNGVLRTRSGGVLTGVVQ